MSEVNIRQVKPGDAEQFILLENYIYRKTYEKILPEKVISKREQQTNTRIAEFSKSHCNDKENICYVAEIDKKVIGYFWGRLISSNEYFGRKRYADLIALYVHPSYQSAGIGTKLKNIFTKWAKDKGALKYVIGVLRDNKKARCIYEKWGGKLENYSSTYNGCEEVFYTYEL